MHTKSLPFNHCQIWLLTACLFTIVLLHAAACRISRSKVSPEIKQAGTTNRKLVWSDEFEYRGLPNPKKWSYETGYVRNKELQYYTQSRAENARVENGLLVIEARNDSLKIKGKTFPVTSACLNTKAAGGWTYGRIEVKAKIPSSLGTWPAIWMLGMDREQAGWPACGEIDIMEHVGFDPEIIHTNVHTKAYNHVLKTNKGKSTQMVKPYFKFHDYILDWTEQKMDFFIDDQLVFTYKNDGTGPAAWPYDKPFYLILNLAFGGAWGGQKGVDASRLPQQLLVDYVRIYQ